MSRFCGDKAYDRKVGDEAPVIPTCKFCHCVLPFRARECPACGEPIFACTPIVEKAGELVEFGSCNRPCLHDERIDERRFIAMVKGYAIEKRYAKPDGFTFYKFQERFGRKPQVYIRDVAPIPPDIATRNWIRGRQIAFAKARQANA